jgi:integrase
MTTPKAPRKGYEKIKLARGEGTLRWVADRKRWRLDHSVEGHDYTELGFDRADCEAKRDARRARLRGEVAVVPEGATLTIAAMFAEWVDHETTIHGKAHPTIKSNRWAARVITRAAGHRDVIALTSVGARSILIELSKTYKSTPKLRSVFNQALQFLVDTGRRPTNPLTGAARIKSDDALANPTEWLSELEAVTTLAYFAANSTREHAALAVSMLAGLRPGEACALAWSEVDWDRMTITVDFTVDRATGKASPKLKTDHHGERHRRAAHRTVPMSAELAKILRQRQREQMATGDSSGYVFAKNGEPMQPQDLFYASKAVSAAVGHGRHVSPNGYRHTFASRLAARSFPATLGAALMGHVDATMWNTTYTHATEDTDTINLDQWLALTPIEAVV